MNNFFPKIKCGVLNDHHDMLGGGTVHSFKLVEYLKRYYDVEVNIPSNAKPKEWLRNFLHLDVDNVKFLPYAKGCGDKYDFLFINISHWKAEPTRALKKFMLVFFPQFFFPVYDYEFLANSKYTKKNIIERWKQPAKKIHVLYPPIMTSNFNPLEKNSRTIMHVSRINKPLPEADKGHRQMITAFKEMVDGGLEGWTFHMVGQIQDQQYYHELRTMANGYPITFNIGVDFRTLQELYGHADIYWHMTGISMPNEAGAQEHFGMTTVESMSSGCVPVVLNTGGQPEIVEDGKNGFLVKDVNGLKEQTLQLINKKAMRKKMSLAAIKRSKDFDEEVVKAKFYSLISKTDKVSIIMLCWNNSRYTKACVERLYEVTPPGFELILVNNGSTDNTSEVLKKLSIKYPNVKIINAGENLGFAKGNNIGLKSATKEYICYLNNDMLPQWGWLERMIETLETYPKVGIVGARLYFNKDANGVFKIQHAGMKLQGNEFVHIGRYKEDKDVRNIGCQEVECTTGACMLMKKELAGFNEGFIRGYYEDTDLCLRTREKGYTIVVNHEARLIHLEGTTLNIMRKRGKKDFDRITESNQILFRNLWSLERIKSLPKISMTPDLKGTSYAQKVEVGGGEHPTHPGYAQVDLKRLGHIKYNNDARVLPFPTNSLTDICSTYTLNCLSKVEAGVALKEWLRCLVPGGKLELYLPNMIEISKNIISNDYEETLLKEVYGHPDNEIDMFRWGYTQKTIDILLSKVGFVRVTYINGVPAHPNSFGVEAHKQK